MSKTIQCRRISWTQFYQVVPHRKPPEGFVPTKQRKAANDNKSSVMSHFYNYEAGREQISSNNEAYNAALAAHKDFISKRCCDGVSTSTPGRIERALVKSHPNAAQKFYHLRELLRPPLIAANDNFPDVDIEPHDRDWGLERGHSQGNIRPTIPEMLRAYDAGQPHGVSYNTKNEASFTRIGQSVEGKFVGLHIGHGEGASLFYGDRKGRKKIAKYEAGKLTSDKPRDEKIERERYLTDLSEYMAINRGPVLRGSLDMVLRIKDRRYSFYTPGVAHYKSGDYGWLCYSAMKGTGENKTSAPRVAELAELDRSNDADHFLSKLDDETRHVIDAMFTADSFSEVAAAVGKNPTAHNGKRLVLSVLENISEKIAA